MKRIALLAILAAALGCSANAPPSQPEEPHKLGAVNNYFSPPCETSITLNNTTTFSATRLTLSMDTLSYVIVTTGTWSGTYTLQASNDNSTWFTLTLPNPPAASTGSPQTTPISYEGGWPWAYARLAFVGSSSTGAASVCPVMKG